MKTEIGEGLFLPNTYKLIQDNPCSNEELIEDFLRWKKSYTKWAYLRYRIWVTRFQEFANCPPEEMKAADYVDFVDYIRGRSSDKNVQFAQNIIHNYLRYFFEQGRLNFPMFLIRVSKVRSESHYCIQEEEYEKIIAVLKAQKGILARRDECIIRMLHDTGVRLGELVGLDVGDLGGDRMALIPTGKTIEDRYVFWSVETQAAIEQYLKAWSQAFGEKIEENQALFRNSKHPQDRLSGRGVGRVVRRACEDAGVSTNICPHSFRHAFIHRMARKGVPDSVTAVLVGHSTPITIAHYTKLNPGEQRHFVESPVIGQPHRQVV